MTFTLFVCQASDMEQAWIESLCAQGDREQEEYERQEDLDREEELALEHAYDDEPSDWPWYADAPIEVEHGEVIEDADLLGWPTAELDEIDPDDEVALDAQEGEVE
jgi:hypothetical protein